MQRIAFVLSALLGLGACQLQPNITLDLSGVRQQAALDGVPLDRFQVRVFADDLEPIETEVDAETDTFSIVVPSGAARTFEVDAVRFIQDTVFTEVPAYRGSVTVDLEPGEVELTIPVRPAGAVRAVARRPLGGTIPAGTTLTLSPSLGGEPITLDATQWEVGIAVDPGLYAVSGQITEGQVTFDVTGALVNVPQGELAVVDAWFVNDATRCLPEVPSAVQQIAPACLPVEVEVMGLVGTGLMVELNGSDTLTLNADGITAFGLGVVEGAALSVAVVADPTPLQSCTVESGPTVSASGNSPFLITCGPPVFNLGGSAVAFDGTGIDVTVDLMLPDMSADQAVVTASPGMPFTFPAPFPDGTTYTASVSGGPTGASLTQECSVLRGSGTIAFADVTDMVVTCVQEVAPIIPITSGGMSCDWNRHVVNDNADPFQLSGTDCVATGMNRYDDCLHCGEMRFVEVPGLGSCADVQGISDSASVFSWECDDSVSPLRVYTRKFDPDGRLGDVLTYTTPGWLPLSVMLTTSDGDTVQTPASVWWGNSVVLDNEAMMLNAPYTVYVSDAPLYPGPNFSLAAEGAALVFSPSANVLTQMSATSQNFLYFEGGVSGVGDGGGNVLTLSSTVGASVRRIESTQDMGVGFTLSDARANRVQDIVCSNMDQGAVITGMSTGNLLRNAFFSNNGSDQVQIDANASDNFLENITIGPDPFTSFMFSPTTGLVVAGSRNRFHNIDIHGMGNHGIIVSNATPAADNVFTNLRLSNNGEASFSSAISLTNAPGTVITNLLATNNYAGIVGTQMGGSFIANATLVGHAEQHLAVDTSDELTVDNVLAVTNAGGVGVDFDGVTNTRVIDLYSFDNDTAVSLDGASDITFSGNLVAGGVTTDCSVSSGTGLEDGTCNNNGSSTATRVPAPAGQATEFVGTIASDSANGCSSGSCVGVAAGSVPDWVAFSNEYRTWGLGPSSPGDSGTCVASSATCDIQDFTLLSGSVAYDTSVSLTEVRHVWQMGVSMATDCDLIPGAVFDSGDCVSFVVGDALELVGDGVGDDDSLCESNETCLTNLHVGAYQGDPATVMVNPVMVTLPNVTNVTFVTNSL